MFKHHENSFRKELDTWPSYRYLLRIRDELLHNMEYEKDELTFWKQRLKKIKIFDETSKLMFDRNDAHSESIPPDESNESGQHDTAMSSLNLIEEIQADPDLRLAFRPLAGKESNLLPSRGHISVHIKQVLTCIFRCKYKMYFPKLFHSY